LVIRWSGLQVPFGGAAFFSGSLIHTNQLLVWHSTDFYFGFNLPGILERQPEFCVVP
jgi:hypothetical protein